MCKCRYTFPSHFFLPQGAELAFVQDGFGGLLPQPFVHTWTPPPQPMNDRNEEEPLRYVPPTAEQRGVASARRATVRDATARGGGGGAAAAKVTRLHCEALIDPRRSTSALARAFAVPHFSAANNHFVNYCVYRNNAR